MSDFLAVLESGVSLSSTEQWEPRSCGGVLWNDP